MQQKKNIIFILIFLLFSLLTPIYAQICKHYGFLSQGFNYTDSQTCKSVLAQCRKNKTCIKKALQKNQVCQQLNKLSKAIKASPDMLTLEQKNNFILIDEFFSADGQHSYYVISPQGCLVNTKIDPRNFNPNLRKQYKNTPFFILNWDKPRLSVQDQNASVTTILKITRTCIACDVVGWAKVKFEFKNGKLVRTRLEDFRQ